MNEQPRSTSRLSLTTREADRLVDLIRPCFKEYVARFDRRKYPPTVYKHLLCAFDNPRLASAAHIDEAIRWKFGHFGKRRIPAHHKRLIHELQKKWPRIVRGLVGPSREVFSRLTQAVGPRHRYITISFLLHLVRPNEIPIIDQHNFRAMNHLLLTVRKGWRVKERPASYDDLAALEEFGERIRSTWQTLDASTAPSDRELDQYLMMFGKALKKRRAPATRLFRSTDNELGRESDLFRNLTTVQAILADPSVCSRDRLHRRRVRRPS